MKGFTLNQAGPLCVIQCGVLRKGDPVFDLVVDLGLLESTDHSLGVLFNEFKDASKIISDHPVGVPALAAALDQFASDWNVHRNDLLNSIDKVRKLAAEGHKQFRATDNKLASSVPQIRVAGARS